MPPSGPGAGVRRRFRTSGSGGGADERVRDLFASATRKGDSGRRPRRTRAAGLHGSREGRGPCWLTRFDLGRFAEAAVLRVSALRPARSAMGRGRYAGRGVDHRQAEQARDGGDVDAAVSNFPRIAAAVPASDIRQQARSIRPPSYSTTSAGLAGLCVPAEFPAQRRRDGCWRLHSGGRQRTGRRRSRAQVDVDGEAGRQRARLAAAELWGSAGRSAEEARVYARLVERFPEPFTEAQEARQRLADRCRPRHHGSKDLARSDREGVVLLPPRPGLSAATAAATRRACQHRDGETVARCLQCAARHAA